MGRVIEFAGRLCLTLLVLCIVYQVMFLAMAFAVQQLTDPPACVVAVDFPMPYAVCPGFGLDSTVEYFMALPGAVLALPFLLPGLTADTGSAMLTFVSVMLVHVLGWGYLIVNL
ncbi:MAG: hypothetical protein OER56_05705, partial [Hyphomicrobiales bacterium]|nr:hypothetical protein [Hyphomicrobiales bacterium]